MKKIISIFLSILLLYSSSVPLCAQDWQLGVDQAMYQAALQHDSAEEEMKELLHILQADTPIDSEQTTFLEAFQTLYVKYIENVYMRKRGQLNQAKKQLQATALNLQTPASIEMACISAVSFIQCQQEYLADIQRESMRLTAQIQDQIQSLQQWKEAQLTAENITKAYQKNHKKFDAILNQEIMLDESYLQEIHTHLKQLAAKLQHQIQSPSITPEKRADLEDLLIQSYPLFWAMQGLDEPQRSWGASLLRDHIKRFSADCAPLSFTASIGERLGKKVLATKEASCQRAIEAATALTILGNSTEDKAALRVFLDQGKHGILAAPVLMIGTTGLLALGAENELVHFLHTEINHFPSVWKIGFDSLDAMGLLWGFQTKLNLYRELTVGIPWVALEQQSAYYQTDKQIRNHAVLGNAWTDIGVYLGQQAQAGNITAQAVITRISRELVSAAGPIKKAHIHLAFPALLGGILLSGYHLPADLIHGENRNQLNGDGSVSRVDTRLLWKEIAQDIEKENLDLEGYLLLELYASGKSDLDPWTKTHLNNTLAAAYYQQKHHRPEQSFLQIHQEPTSTQIEQYQSFKKQEKIAGYADIAAAVLGIFCLGAGLIKGVAAGSRSMMSQLGKTISMARNGQALVKIPSLSAKLTRFAQVRTWRLNYIDRLGKTFETSMSLPKVPVTEVPFTSEKINRRALEKLLLKSVRTNQNAPKIPYQSYVQATKGKLKAPKFQLIAFEDKTAIQAGASLTPAPTALQTPAISTVPTIQPLPITTQPPLPSKPFLPKSVAEPSFIDLLTKNIAGRAFETREELSAMGRSLWYAKKHILLPICLSWQLTSAPTSFLPRALKSTQAVRVEYVTRTISNLPEITGMSVSALKAFSPIKSLSAPATLPVAKGALPTGTTFYRNLFNVSGFTPILPVAAYRNEQLLKMGGAFRFSPTQPAVVRDYQQQMAQYQRYQPLRATTMPLAAPAITITPLFSSAPTPWLNQKTSITSSAAAVAPLLIVAGSLLPQQVAAAPIFLGPNSMDLASSGLLWGTAAILGAWGLIGSGIFQSDGFNQFLQRPVRAVNIPHQWDLKHPVWKLKNILGQSIGYLKMTSLEEQERTQQFDDLIQQIDPSSIDLLSIQYPKIKSVGWEKIPLAVRNRIQTQAATIKLSPSKQPETILQLSAVDTSGASLGSLSDENNIEAFREALRYQPISFSEWNQVVGLITKLNQAGFEHTDLPANLWFKRLANGNLQITLLDFEKRAIYPGREHDVNVLRNYQQKLQDYHLLREKSILDAPENRPYYLSQADEKLENRLVWEVQNRFHKKIGYVKITDLVEMQRTKKFHELAQQKIPDLELIEIDYPRVLSEGWVDLPRRIQKPLLEYGDKDFVVHRSVGPFIISSVDVSGFMPSLVVSNKAMRTHGQRMLHGTPMMAVEWEEILSFFRYLNEKGFNHGDLMHNLWIRRNADGKLKVTLLDFEYIEGIDPGDNDVQTLQIWERNLRDANLLQQNAPQGIPSWQRMFMGEPDF